MTAVISASDTLQQSSTWSSDSNASWLAGDSSNGYAYLTKWTASAWHRVPTAFGTGIQIKSLSLLRQEQLLGENPCLDDNKILVVPGFLVLAVGNVSAALFTGTNCQHLF